MEITAYKLAERFIGVKELPGAGSNPFVLSMLTLDSSWPADDDVPWCSAFVNYVAWMLRLPRSKSLAARSWLTVGVPIEPAQAVIGFDVVVLSRGSNPDQGHVGFFSGFDGTTKIALLGGNQGDQVSVASFESSRIVGIRRLA